MQGRRARAQRCGQEWLVRSDWYGTGGCPGGEAGQAAGAGGTGGRCGCRAHFAAALPSARLLFICLLTSGLPQQITPSFSSQAGPGRACRPQLARWALGLFMLMVQEPRWPVVSEGDALFGEDARGQPDFAQGRWTSAPQAGPVTPFDWHCLCGAGWPLLPPRLQFSRLPAGGLGK